MVKKITELIPADYNPRKKLKPGDKEYEKLKKLLMEFGYVDPVIWNEKTGRVVGGHQRLEVMQEMGVAEVMVSVVDLPEDKEKALNVALNKISGEWDQDKLVDLLHELGDMVELTGFDAEELDKLFDNKADVQEDDFDADAALAEITEPVTKRGDIWQLGRHRLMCGDSTDKETVEMLTSGAEIEIVYTDPPYSSGGYQESGKTSGSIGARGGKKIETDNLSTRGYISLMDKVIALSRNAHTVFIFCDWKMWATNQDIAEAKGFRVRNMIVWDKCQMGMGMPFRNQHELCLFGSKLAGKIGDGKTPNVISVPRDRKSEHATPKPVELIKPMLSQIEGGTIYDPFGGSGSTLIACEQLNRICYMMELDEKYCDVIIKRWETLTGGKAELLDG